MACCLRKQTYKSSRTRVKNKLSTASLILYQLVFSGQKKPLTGTEENSKGTAGKYEKWDPKKEQQQKTLYFLFTLHVYTYTDTQQEA